MLEIGTHDGLNALRMLRLTEARYYGFDLFENMDEQAFNREFALRPPSRAEVLKQLSGYDVSLYAGDTRVTLPNARLPKMDFIFIDGGHSEETVASDWANCRRLMHDRTVVYFDDYPQWGVGPVVDSIEGAEIMPEFDEFPHTGRLYLARVAGLRGKASPRNSEGDVIQNRHSDPPPPPPAWRCAGGRDRHGLAAQQMLELPTFRRWKAPMFHVKKRGISGLSGRSSMAEQKLPKLLGHE